jgi:hypothetical protein
MKVAAGFWALFSYFLSERLPGMLGIILKDRQDEFY